MAVVVTRASTEEPDDEVAFWRSRPPAERVAAVEVLRRRVFEGVEDATGSRLQRVHQVVRHS
jgi:hypothetical protein